MSSTASAAPSGQTEGACAVFSGVWPVPACPRCCWPRPLARARYVGIDLGDHHTRYAAKKFADADIRLRTGFVRGDGESLPFRSESFDVAVMTEVIEHLMRPDLAVWEVARVLRTGGTFVMTTNNASEAPSRSPLSHAFVWIEKMVAVSRPGAISYRPWVWPAPVDADLLPAGSSPVYLPHTHHIQAETRALLGAAGLESTLFRTFEFPPPHSAVARWLAGRGEAGRVAVDALEAVARRVPLVNRLGTHLMMVATKTGPAVSSDPPPGLWPGPRPAG